MLTDFCGKELPVPVMSSGPNLTVEFEAFYSSPHLRGFQALYYFVTGKSLEKTVDYGQEDEALLATYA